MAKSFLIITVLFTAVILSGCETIKYTATGPFIGLSKDIENARNAIQGVHPIQKVGEADDWVKRNLW